MGGKRNFRGDFGKREVCIKRHPPPHFRCLFQCLFWCLPALDILYTVSFWTFFKGLKIQGEQRSKLISVCRMCLIQALAYRCLKLFKPGIIFRPQAFLFGSSRIQGSWLSCLNNFNFGLYCLHFFSRWEDEMTERLNMNIQSLVSNAACYEKIRSKVVSIFLCEIIPSHFF